MGKNTRRYVNVSIVTRKSAYLIAIVFRRTEAESHTGYQAEVNNSDSETIKNQPQVVQVDRLGELRNMISHYHPIKSHHRAISVIDVVKRVIGSRTVLLMRIRRLRIESDLTE